MKIKTDLYTKVVLTTIALFLGVIVFKDINFVAKAQATELDVSALKVEESNDDITFFIYDNDKIKKPFTVKSNSFSGTIYSNECEISSTDTPVQIVTTKRIPADSYITIKKTN